MYKGIGQYFPFHVEMKPFHRDKTTFTLGYIVRIFGKQLFPLKPAQRRTRSRKNVYLQGNSIILFLDLCNHLHDRRPFHQVFKMSAEAVKPRIPPLLLTEGGHCSVTASDKKKGGGKHVNHQNLNETLDF